MLELRNYNGLMAVFAALNLQVIQRLKTTWRDVPERYIKKLEPLEYLLDSRSNFKHYREVLETAEPPFIPFQGIFMHHASNSLTTIICTICVCMYVCVCLVLNLICYSCLLDRSIALLLGDLTGLENMPDRTESGAINFQKMLAIGKTLKMIQDCQAARYNLWEVEPLMDFLEHDILVLGEEELYKLSKHCENIRKPITHKKRKFTIQLGGGGGGGGK
jgi:hypothetical protein